MAAGLKSKSQLHLSLSLSLLQHWALADHFCPLTAIILLSFVLALGFLLLILSCALFSNWLPILVALNFVFAPLPNSLCARCAGADDFSADYNSAYVDFGNWLTSGIVVMGFAMPITLAHSGVITETAGMMSVAGGALVYGTSELRGIILSHRWLLWTLY
jgi:hypothetical protein